MRSLIRDRFSYETDESRRGGFSTVYRGVDLASRPPKEVAVKILDGAADTDPLVQTFFDREVQSLLALEHPNIVGLVDAGIDSYGQYFLVLEWLEDDLRSWLERNPSPPWEDFIIEIALPIAEALAFAHQRHVIHRDIKPTNVLMAGDGTPKLADFGIAKIKSDLTVSPHTTIDFISRPYAPPEKDSTFSRDVFAFGVLVLNALSESAVTDFPDLETAVADLDVHPSIAQLLERCVSLTPDRRPKNGVVLHDELRAIIDERQKRRSERLKVCLELGKTAEKKLEEGLGLSGSPLTAAVLADLADAPALRSALPPEVLGQVDGRQIYLAGAAWSYRVAVRIVPGRPPVLFVMGAQAMRSGDADRSRDHDLVLTNVDFTFEPPLSAKQSASDIAGLVAELDRHIANREILDEEREQRRLLEQWRAQLHARQAVEQRRENPIRYSRFRREGRRFTFVLDYEPHGVEIGELRRVESERRGRPASGEVESVSGVEIVLWFDDDPPSIPSSGRLVLDTAAASIKIDREKSALLALIHRTTDVVNPGLRDVIIDPSSQEPPSEAVLSEWFRSDLDSDKKDVVQRALGNSGMFAVEGPPGTGKTTFIAELVAQELVARPKSRILVASQTNVALDNALVRIADHVDVETIVRLADRHGARVAGDAQRLLIDAQVDRWINASREASRRNFETWCASHGLQAAELELAGGLSEIARLRDGLSAVEKLRAEAEAALAGGMDDVVGDDRADLEAEVERLKERATRFRRDSRAIESRLEKRANAAGMDAVKARPEELRSFARRVFERLGDGKARAELYVSWMERLGRTDDFVEALLTNAQVLGGTCIGVARYRDLRSVEFDLCIVDEASKATATETLVPMVRSKRWVLVGDQNQLPPFQEEALRHGDLIEEFELDSAELKRTLFDRMLAGLPSESRCALTVQRRMTEAIGELVSQCFYGGSLISLGPDPLPALPGLLPRPVTWWTTSSLPNRQEVSGGIDGRSYSNPAEVRVVRGIIERLAFMARASALPQGLEVLVIAPYSAQVGELRRQMDSLAGQLEAFRVEVNTIDAVQGREADLVIFSTVRSNTSENVGFLESDKRANVALSRARRGLIVVGDSLFLGGVRSPFREVLAHIETHPQHAAVEEVSA